MSTKGSPRHSVEALERQLGELAMRFRGTRVERERDKVVREYARTVEQLIETGCWTEVPSPEDQLPDRCMPQEFFEYWSCQSRGGSS